MPGFSIPLSGLLSNEEALGIISNNLANLNTPGFKDVTPEFADLFSQQLALAGDGNPIQVGLGTQVESTSTQFTQGNLTTTGANTDIAIQGDGFLQLQKAGLTLYTRDGNLSIDKNGFIVTQDGANVMGFPAVNGVITPGSAPVAIQIPNGQTSAPIATANVTLNMNLDASAAVGTNFSTSAGVFDSLGVTHVLTYNFTKTAANNWSYQITIPAADVGGAGAPVVLNSGTLTFDGTGKLIGPAANVAGVTASGLADGAKNLTLAWDLYNSTTNTPVVTQVAGASTVSSSRQDGLPSGTLVSFTIEPDGTIAGAFTNGQTEKLGQVALSTFPNSEGLLRIGLNNFVASLASGLPSVGVPGTGGRGTIADGNLENSNVDIASEFAKLILAQRGYEANARAFTTQNTVLQDTINLGQ